MRDFEKCPDRHGRKIVYLFISIILSGFVIRLLWWHMAEDYCEPFGWLFLSIVRILLVALIIVALFKDMWIQAFIQFFDDMRHKSFGRLLYVLLVGFLAVFVTGWGIGPILSGMLRRISVNQQAVASLIRLDASCVFYFINIVILGPLVEETQFRCGLYRLMRSKNVVAAHVVTALLFGLAHVIGPILQGAYEELWFLINYTIFGFAFSVVYEKTKCPMYPLLLHMAINFVAFVGALYS